MRNSTRKRGMELSGAVTPQSRQLGDSEKALRFSADTAAATGMSERSIQRAAERGEKISEEALELIRGTELDTGVFLDEIKDLPPEDQLERVTTELGRAEIVNLRAPPRKGEPEEESNLTFNPLTKSKRS